MAYGYWRSQKAGDEAAFHLFFRENPFGGGYTVAAGLETAIDYLDHLRFDAREEANDPGFAAELAANGDLFVQDAFGAVHRPHASTVGIAQQLPSAAGLLLEAELDAFANLLDSPARR